MKISERVPLTVPTGKVQLQRASLVMDVSTHPIDSLEPVIVHVLSDRPALSGAI